MLSTVGFQLGRIEGRLTPRTALVRTWQQIIIRLTHVFVAELFLDCADVVAILENVGVKAWRSEWQTAGC